MSLSKRKNNQQPARRRQGQHDQSSTGQSSSQIFRRGRTLTGTSSRKFSSSSEQQADIKSPRTLAHELAVKRRRLTRLFAGVFTGVVLCSVVLWQLIAGVDVYGGKSVALDSSVSYRDTVNEYLKRHPLERFRFSLDEDALSAFVTSKHPEVELVVLSQPSGLASSKFELVMREPVAKWRVTGENQYVDGSGVAFTVNYYEPPTIEITDNSGIDPSSGVTVASGRFLGFIGNLVRLSESLNYTPTGIEIPTASTRQIEVSYKEFDYPVKYTVDRPVGEQVEDMTRAIGYLRSAGESPGYLDVRVSGRSFYK